MNCKKNRWLFRNLLRFFGKSFSIFSSILKKISRISENWIERRSVSQDLILRHKSLDIRRELWKFKIREKLTEEVCIFYSESIGFLTPPIGADRADKFRSVFKFWTFSRESRPRYGRLRRFHISGGIRGANGENLRNSYVVEKVAGARGGFPLIVDRFSFLLFSLSAVSNCCWHKQSLTLLDFDVFVDSSISGVNYEVRDHIFWKRKNFRFSDPGTLNLYVFKDPSSQKT